MRNNQPMIILELMLSSKCKIDLKLNNSDK